MDIEKHGEGIDSGPPNINMSDVIIHVTPKNDAKLKATVILEYHGIKIKGFRVSNSIYENDDGQMLWVQPPSFNINGKYVPMVFIEDTEAWKLIEKKILQDYSTAINEEGEVSF